MIIIFTHVTPSQTWYRKFPLPLKVLSYPLLVILHIASWSMQSNLLLSWISFTHSMTSYECNHRVYILLWSLCLLNAFWNLSHFFHVLVVYFLLLINYYHNVWTYHNYLSTFNNIYLNYFHFLAVFAYKSLCWHICLFLLGKYLKVGFLSHRVSVFFTLNESKLLNNFLK